MSFNLFDVDSYDFNINAVKRERILCAEHPKYEKLCNERKKKVGLKQIARRHFASIYFRRKWNQIPLLWNIIENRLKISMNFKISTQYVSG